MSTKTIPSAATAGEKSRSVSSNVKPLKVESYLFFDGRCEEAIEFYRRALGAEVTMLMRFRDAPDPSACGPVPGEKIMHASFRIGETTINASDGGCAEKTPISGFALSLNAPNEAEATRRFNLLAEGGQVQQPLGPTFFAKSFGMVVDRFGVRWMVIVLP